jgi:ATP-dependent Clp protease ATP-binding subunit ClpB
VLDDGRMTDGQGRTVNFKNTVIVMTSNLGSQMIQQMAGDDYQVIKLAVMAEVKSYFRPEFLNRIDEVVTFEALTREQLADIVELQLARLRERLAERKIELELTDAVRELLAEEGWDPAYGARPLKRAIQRLLENPLARELLERRFVEGDTVRVDVADGELVFERVEVGAPTAAPA